MVRDNLKKAFDHHSKTQLKETERIFYRNFCDFIVETIKGVSIDKNKVKKRVVFTNLNEVEDMVKESKSVLFLAAHQFNWELMLLSAVLQFPISIDYVYHPLHHKGSDELMLKMRSRFGAEPVKRGEVGRLVIRRRNQSRCYALVADQLPRSKDKKLFVDFFNIKTGFFQGIEQIAHLINGPVAYFHIIKVKRGYYEVKMVTLTHDPKNEPEGAIVKAYARALEENIKEQPAGWLWSHKRWKRSK